MGWVLRMLATGRIWDSPWLQDRVEQTLSIAERPRKCFKQSSQVSVS